jgi:TRAP-type C4-dicarboxylate transport system permease small subunit
MGQNKKIFDRIIDFMAFLAGVLLVGAVLIVCFEIWMRYFAHKPQVWTVEICEYILFGIAFLGAPWLLKKGGHVSIDIMVAQTGPRTQIYLGLFSKAMGILVSAVVCGFSMATSWESYVSGVVVIKTLSIPKCYFLMLISFGYFLLLVEFARQFLGHFRELRGKN